MPSPAESPTTLAVRIRDEIERDGPMRFERFMELALYEPGLGYYVRGPKPVGQSGDFFTASQMQPVYSQLIRRYAERLSAEQGMSLPQVITEFGAGRSEMAEGFSDWEYRAVEAGTRLPVAPLSGFVFANELFDAIPVNVGVCREGQIHEKRVVWSGSGFAWEEMPTPSIELGQYAERFRPPAEDGFEFETHQRGLLLLSDLLTRARNALFVFVDYGYMEREWKRFPAGSLMSYRKHRATPEVLAEPGERDITSHVPFHALMETAIAGGAEVLRMERLSQALLFAGETDSFAGVLGAATAREEFKRRQQLKTLLYGLGEGFYALALRKS